VVPLAAEYMEIFFLGLPFLFGYFVFSALMRGYGNTRAPMLIMAVSVVIDPIPIFGVRPVPRLGIGGAAIAAAWVTRGTWRASVIEEGAEEADDPPETDSPESDGVAARE